MEAVVRLGATVPDPVEETAWLNRWHWLVPPEFRAICATALGDAFLRDPHGSIWWLDAGSGKLDLIGDQTLWESKLRDPAQLDQWSGRVLVQRLEAAGLIRKPGECYTYFTSPVLGGAYEPSNFKVVPIQTHFNIWGPLLERINGLPEGTKVEFKVVP